MESGIKNADVSLTNGMIDRLLKVPDTKKHIKNQINDIDQMLNDLDIDEDLDKEMQGNKPKIDINELDVVDVLHNILH